MMHTPPMIQHPFARLHWHPQSVNHLSIPSSAVYQILHTVHGCRLQMFHVLGITVFPRSPSRLQFLPLRTLCYQQLLSDTLIPLFTVVFPNLFWNLSGSLHDFITLTFSMLQKQYYVASTQVCPQCELYQGTRPIVTSKCSDVHTKGK